MCDRGKCMGVTMDNEKVIEKRECEDIYDRGECD